MTTTGPTSPGDFDPYDDQYDDTASMPTSPLIDPLGDEDLDQVAEASAEITEQTDVLVDTDPDAVADAVAPAGSPAPVEVATETTSAAAPEDVAALAAAVTSAMEPVFDEQRAKGAISPKWEERHYAPGGNNGSAAWKLGDSAVAPLVAAARGYETVHEDSLPEATKKFGLPRKNSAQGKRLAEAATRGDILIMPWFTTEDLAVAARSAKEPVPSTIQYRPAKPALNDKGKELKYEFVSGHDTPVGIHPAYGRDWIDGAPVVLLAEGMLKGDSALTGYLLDAGVSPEALAFDGVGGTVAARARLSGILDLIPVERRVVILTIGGVWNWRNNPEWRDISLKGRTTWVGVDGDVSSNPMVYKACVEIWDFLQEKKKTTPLLIAPSVQAEGGEKKVGIDDYLARYGNWSGLTAMLSPTLPPAPPTNDVENIEKYRISEDGCRLEYCEPEFTDVMHPTVPTGGKWKTVLNLGGKILSTVAQRTPTPQEIRTGQLGLGANNDAAEAYCEIEISWKVGDQVERHVVSGPASILNYTPDQWDRHKAHIPAAVLRHEEWPPPRKIGEDWLRAMKGHQADLTKDRTRWDVMGWVPVEGTVPAFVVGDQIIGADDSADVDIFAGIGEQELAGAARFGVGEEIPDDFEDPTYCAKVRNDIEEVIETFILSGAYADRRVASTLVAAALRPALPIRPHATLYLVGPPGKGKSWSAANMMGFWSNRPGSFTGSSLPGSAKDTLVAIEMSIARAPIWVIDDLAPASSRQQSESEQNKIGDVIRNVFNGAAKRRSNADMGSRKVFTPRALLVVTAENEPQVASVIDRCITLDIGHGALSKSSDPTNRVEELCIEDGAPARVTQALIRFLRYEAKGMPGSWPELFSLNEAMLAKAQDDAKNQMRKPGAKSGSLRRHADLAGDIAVSLLWLRRMAQKVGVAPEILDLLDNRAMLGDIYDIVAQGSTANKEGTPGRRLLEAVQSTLFRGKGHIIDATPGVMPGDQHIAQRLGWEFGSDGTARPKGERVGVLYTDADTGEQFVFLERKAAFSVAQREYPNLIPSGQGPRSSWASVVGEGLSAEQFLRKTSDGGRMASGRTRAGEVDISGVPIALDVLLRGGAPDSTETP